MFKVSRHICIKLAVLCLAAGMYQTWIEYSTGDSQTQTAEIAVDQMDHAQATRDLRHSQWQNGQEHILGWSLVCLLGVVLFAGDVSKALTGMVVLALILPVSGCYRPFQPVKLEVIQPTEEAFLIPFTVDPEKQKSSNTEAFYRDRLVHVQQIQMPQQWVPKGYEWFGVPNGMWQDAAMLIRVDKAAITRHWTAEKNTGTAAFDQSIWAMTSDQVEFSTGWTCTAMIATKDDAITFLHNYPNGHLDRYMDSEIRMKLASDFGLEVTDLPMEVIRKAVTPHILHVVDSVKTFFKPRGITIMNLGITGGFVYKDQKIGVQMTRVFTAEQEKSIAAAEVAAQSEHNKRIIMEADGKAESMLKLRKAEADGIKMTADARAYELEKASKNLDVYFKLKQAEITRDLVAKWNGAFPHYMASGTAPMSLLQLPAMENTAEADLRHKN